MRSSAFLAVLTLTACGASEEPAPLADGIALRYEWSMFGGGALLEVAVRKDGEHFVLEFRAEESSEELGLEPLRVDRFCRTADGKLATLAEVPLWLPSPLREPGSDIVPDDSIRIGPKTKRWESWNVHVARGGMTEWYYDQATGFLVGSHAEAMGSGMTVRLVQSNLPGLPAAAARH